MISRRVGLGFLVGAGGSAIVPPFGTIAAMGLGFIDMTTGGFFKEQSGSFSWRRALLRRQQRHNRREPRFEHLAY
jgi:hypothetical protein